MNWDRYNRLRKRLAPVAFAVALVVLVRETCTSKTRHEVTITVDTAPWTDRVRSLDGALMVGAEQVAELHHEAHPGIPVGTVTFVAAVPSESAELVLHVTLLDGVREVHKQLATPEGAAVSVPLGPDLAPRP